ncbi:plant cysteine oxidase 4 isoform X2 [Cryptomeria japonica]|uniref:plant cysteine oxidase 4 isoform X2 n=1 Tax=Cryptomeria japonica TaxID=3369 RepID=UPI0025AD80E0|nr:plant cysteine oxidase 4 isoform X2 [Cryptomeria japonica]
MDAIKPIDVGFDENEILRADDEAEKQTCTYMGTLKRRRLTSNTAVATSPQSLRSPRVTYVHLHECDSFSMGIFCLPKSAVIPLHDHPGMTVFSKVLYGSMHVSAYDWYDQHKDTQHFGGMKLAKPKVDTIYNESSGSTVLYPARAGNIHCFTALTSCAVLDILSPPYADGDPSYYRLHPYSGLPLKRKEQKEYEDCVWLEEIERPRSFKVNGQAYRGPIIETI